MVVMEGFLLLREVRLYLSSALCGELRDFQTACFRIAEYDENTIRIGRLLKRLNTRT